MAEKIFYTMGELAEMFDVKQSLIRHWESQFSVLRPQRNKKGNRLFSPADVENLKLIYHLVKERGMTLEGAKKALRQKRTEGGVSRDAELMERLQHIRSLLVEVREDLKVEADDILPNEGDGPAEAAGVAQVEPGQVVGLEAVEADEKSAAKRPQIKAKPVVKITDEADAKAVVKDSETDKQSAVRRPRRKKEDAENKELFAFYEQSLF